MPPRRPIPARYSRTFFRASVIRGPVMHHKPLMMQANWAFGVRVLTRSAAGRCHFIGIRLSCPRLRSLFLCIRGHFGLREKERVNVGKLFDALAQGGANAVPGACAGAQQNRNPPRTAPTIHHKRLTIDDRLRSLKPYSTQRISCIVSGLRCAILQDRHLIQRPLVTPKAFAS
jgi:hypothetical protein